MGTALENFAQAYQASYNDQLNAAAKAAALRLQEQQQAETMRYNQAREAIARDQLGLNKLSTLSAIKTAGYQQEDMALGLEARRAIQPSSIALTKAQYDQQIDAAKNTVFFDDVRQGKLSFEDAVKQGADAGKLRSFALARAQNTARQNDTTEANTIANRFNIAATFGWDQKQNLATFAYTGPDGAISHSLLSRGPGFVAPPPDTLNLLGAPATGVDTTAPSPRSYDPAVGVVAPPTMPDYTQVPDPNLTSYRTPPQKKAQSLAEARAAYVAKLPAQTPYDWGKWFSAPQDNPNDIAGARLAQEQ
jgi:hypothetical protein